MAPRLKHQPRFNLRLPPELDERLTAAVEERRVTKTAAICEAIAQWLDGGAKPEPKPQGTVGRRREPPLPPGPPSRDYSMPPSSQRLPKPPEQPQTPTAQEVLAKLRALRQ